jgi:hypothetical protein
VEELQAKDGYVSKLLRGQIKPAAATDAEKEPSASIDTAGPQSQISPAGLAEDDASRQLGDWSVYKYYFRTIGPNATIIFLLLTTGWAFLNAFPSTFFFRCKFLR